MKDVKSTTDVFISFLLVPNSSCLTVIGPIIKTCFPSLHNAKKELGIFAGRLPAPHGKDSFAEQMEQATFVVVRSPVQKARETLRTCKGLKQLVLWSLFICLFFQNVQPEAAVQVPPSPFHRASQSPLSNLRAESAANSLCVKGRVLALSQGNEFTPYKVRMDSVLH